MILDRVNKTLYAAESVRTNESIVHHFASIMNYKPLMFRALDNNNHLVYHTNVIMMLGEKVAIISTETIKNKEEKDQVITQLQSSGHEIVDISFDQVLAFAGNVLEVKNSLKESCFVMSSSAYNAFLPDQINLFRKHGIIIHSDIPTIEKYGGGSVRCMMAEIFLTKRKSS